MKNRFVPELVKSFDGSKGWKEMSGGQHHTLALDKNGKFSSFHVSPYTLGGTNRMCIAGSHMRKLPQTE